MLWLKLNHVSKAPGTLHWHFKNDKIALGQLDNAEIYDISTTGLEQKNRKAQQSVGQGNNFWGVL